MSLSRRHFTALLLIGAVACASDTLAPTGSPLALPAIQTRFVLPPGSTPASFGLAIDSVRVTIFEQDTTCGECGTGPTVVDTLVTLAPTDPGVRLRVTLDPPRDSTQWELNLSMYGGGQFLFYGSSAIAFQRGTFALPPIPVYYSGPGSGAEDLQMAPGDTALVVGDTVDFTATAFAGGLPLDTAYISWRVSDPTKLKIDHLGHLTALPGSLGSSVLVTATIPNGVGTSVRVSVPNTAVAIQKVSGDSQSVPVGQVTPRPLVVRVVDGSGKPVAGARVRFFPTVVSTFVANDTAIYSDQFGLARTGVSPITVGTGTVSAAVAGTPIHFDFTVTGAASTAAPLLFAADSGLSGYQLYRADSNGASRIRLAFLNGSGIYYTAPRWNAGRTRLAYTTYNGNTATLELVLTTPVGDTSATLVSDVNATEGRFDPTGKALAFNCGTTAENLYSGDVCTVTGVDQLLGGLNGAGNGAGRTMVSAVVPGRPTGAPGFAWRPGSLTRIAFARDSIADPLGYWTASRIYETNTDGSGRLPLSPPVMDAGGGPLRVQAGMDWSPDGSTIVFSATDTTNNTYTASLYLLDVATGKVRRLTTPPYGWYGDLYPRFSPDGQRVLFRRTDYHFVGSMVMDYYVQRVTGGGPVRITYAASSWTNIYDPYYLGGDWSPDGASVVVAAPNGLGGLGAYRIPIDVTSALDVAARRILVGTAGIAGLNDLGVSWGR